MNRKILFLALLVGGMTSAADASSNKGPTVPEPFAGHDPASTYVIRYADLDAVLRASVVDVGRSSRKKAEPAPPTTGTLMKSTVRRATVNEGNRFRFEAYEENEDLRQVLGTVRRNLESIPSQAPLELFSRDEQLAYWLNLYNVTLLDEIVAVYPERSLKKLIRGRKSILPKKILRVAGVDLSLDDIQHVILRRNYDDNPLVVYGLYQGIIGGPDIRRKAYTGKDVYRMLADNARDFINSNRGTAVQRSSVFHVSSLYERNGYLFPDFEADLTAHLMNYIEGYEREALMSASRIKPDIDDWSITDLYGSYRDVGGSFATNKAALLDSVKATTMVDYQVINTGYSDTSGFLVTHAPNPNRFNPELLAHLKEIQAREQEEYLRKGGTVTVEELGQAPGSKEPEGDEEND